MAIDELVSIPEAARRLGGLSVWTIRAWLSKGRLQRTKVGGRTMVATQELERFLRDCAESASGRGISGKPHEGEGR
jgi:excisionase family DNA binding protein